MTSFTPHPASNVIHAWDDSMEQVIFHCAKCGRGFFGRPRLVISIQNYPLCIECAQWAIDLRKQNGLQVVEIVPSAYEGGYVPVSKDPDSHEEENQARAEER